MKLRKIITFAVVLTSLLISFSLASAQEKSTLRSIAIDDHFKLKRVGNPQTSPDGKWVAFTVSSTDLAKNESKTRIWKISVAGGEAIPMTAKEHSSSLPKWSPDGKYFSFLSARNKGKTQVWVLNTLGGEAIKLTDIKQGVKDFFWAPDGKRILLTIVDPGPDDLEEDKDKKKKKRPWIVDRIQFKEDDAGYLDNRRTHLYTFDLADKKVIQITSGNFDDSDPAWSPEGKSIAFVSNRTKKPDTNEDSDIWIVSADNTDKGKTLLKLTKNRDTDSSPVWSPDGTSISYITIPYNGIFSGFNTSHIALISSKGGTPKALTSNLDRNVSSLHFTPDGKTITFLLEDSGENNLASIDINGKNLKRLVTGKNIVNRYHLGKNGAIAVVVTTPHFPAEIFMLENKDLRKLTSVNDALISELKLAEVENIHYKSIDGTEIEAFIYKPIGFNPNFKYPTILAPHGGPTAQYTYEFDFEYQLWAANGYLVVAPNPRGSTGYGQEFTQAIYAKWGQKDFEDVIAGVDYVIEKGYADPDRLGVGGWSYGGIMTNYVITQSQRFKGAVSGASIAFYRANYGHDIYQLWYDMEFGLPWENTELWDKLSPMSNITNVKTPTLFIGGKQDFNCPILHSEMMYQSLKKLGVPTQLVVYPDENHGIEYPAFRKDRYERYLNWFNKYVKGEDVK
ncbi:MAG: prolyl oligopeptidase family serine peptidase [Candidatus Aminicenantes bacterium]|nr:prolyl oligopeptidase family serine peptidase [Candidatus Aminicenantes bacterium]